MATLEEAIKSVKEGNLSKDQLESYRDQMSVLFSMFQLEMADLEKEEALFMNGKKDEQSIADRKRQWKATESGLKLIKRKREATATKEMLSSLRNRLFNIY